ncbi:FHA domain-containing protein [bacterium]|nr:FHA domain-containing protein [bacterium]
MPKTSEPLAILPPGAFRLRVIREGVVVHELTFEKPVVTLGRENTCDVHLDHHLVSRHHAEIRRADDLFAIVDLKSTNGVMLNEKPVVEIARLSSGDRVQIGPFQIGFSSSGTSKLAIPEGFGPGDKLRVTARRAGVVAPPTPTSTLRQNEILELAPTMGFLIARLEGGESRQMIVDHFQVGASPDCELRLTSPGAPWKLALIVRGPDQYRLYNLGPDPTAVLVDGKPVANWAALQDKDHLVLGGRQLVFEQAATSSRQETTRRVPPQGEAR